MVCSFCNENECESWMKSYCVDCSMLRRMLVLHNPTECVDVDVEIMIPPNAKELDENLEYEGE